MDLPWNIEQVNMLTHSKCVGILGSLHNISSKYLPITKHNLSITKSIKFFLEFRE